MMVFMNMIWLLTMILPQLYFLNLFRLLPRIFGPLIVSSQARSKVMIAITANAEAPATRRIDMHWNPRFHRQRLNADLLVPCLFIVEAAMVTLR